MKSLNTSSLLVLTAVLLSACGGGSSEPQITQGSTQIGSAPTGTIVAASSASIVHVDKSERIATLRRGRKIPNGTFLKALDRKDKQTGLLKVRPMPSTGLRTAYVLEGEPTIGDDVSAVSAAERRRLKRTYPEGDSE